MTPEERRASVKAAAERVDQAIRDDPVDDETFQMLARFLRMWVPAMNERADKIARSYRVEFLDQ